MIMHLPRLVAAPRYERHRRFDRARRFHVHEPAGNEARHARRQQPFPRLLAERRIEEDDVEAPAFNGEKSSRFSAMGLERHRPEYRGRRPQRVDQRAIAVDGNGQGSSARDRFEGECAGSGVGLEAALTGQLLAQPVEQRFANPVGRWPQLRRLREAHDATAPGTADDANPIGRDVGQVNPWDSRCRKDWGG